MRIVTLLENSSKDQSLKPKHGISLYIETDQSKILFDAGPDDSFVKNAEKLKVDLSAVDVMVLSHGHVDHGGGLAAFMEINKKAPIILKDSALKPFYAKLFWKFKVHIGLNVSGLDMDRFKMISDDYKISEQARIFTHFAKNGFVPSGNLSLLTRTEDNKVMVDPFDHEICLLLQEEGKKVLITGCSHSGLGNMVHSVIQKAGIDSLDLVLGGFHLYNPLSRQAEPHENIDGLLEELKPLSDTRFYSGHCTGEEPFRYMKSILKDRLQPFYTGLDLTV